MIQFSHYGEERGLICTEQEREMFNVLKTMFKDLGYDDSLFSWCGCPIVM